ncbi:MAG: hypothetical protein Q7S00_02620, partial [bacterium]|nr:hypothetical protein [bacterium]
MILPWIARRTLTSGGKPLFVTLFSHIGRVGIALGVLTLIVVLSVMNGFEQHFQKRIIGFNGMVTVQGEKSSLEEIRRRLNRPGLRQRLLME